LRLLVVTHKKKPDRKSRVITTGSEKDQLFMLMSEGNRYWLHTTMKGVVATFTAVGAHPSLLENF